MIQWGPMRNDNLQWLPVDSWFVSSLFSFGHVHGIAKVFLAVEIILSAAVVVGTLVMVFLHFSF